MVENYLILTVYILFYALLVITIIAITEMVVLAVIISKGK